MKWINTSHSTAEAALQWDEDQLYRYESNITGPLLRTWEHHTHAVIIGKGNTITAEVHQDICQQDNIPIIKRCSGGGTVLIGPGCLCYSLILPLTFHPQLTTINGSNTWIMHTMATGLSQHLKQKITVKGITDLCLNTQKFSGNAQRRLKKSLLFHGTLLYNFDLSLISKYLPYPSLSPSYRKQRDHNTFITQLPTTTETQLIQTLRKIWKET